VGGVQHSVDGHKLNNLGTTFDPRQLISDLIYIMIIMGWKHNGTTAYSFDASTSAIAKNEWSTRVAIQL
jgi:hypothetical protein